MLNKIKAVSRYIFIWIMWDFYAFRESTEFHFRNPHASNQLALCGLFGIVPLLIVLILFLAKYENTIDISGWIIICAGTGFYFLIGLICHFIFKRVHGHSFLPDVKK